jgi:hypothetical protein
MSASLFVKVTLEANLERGLQPPGDSRIWETLRKGLGKQVHCVYSDVIMISVQDPKLQTLPSETFLQFWLGFSGVHSVTVEVVPKDLHLQVRRRGVESDALVTLLREQLDLDGYGRGHLIWKARDYTFEDHPLVLTALNGILLMGSRSGVFDPQIEEARVMGVGDVWTWPLPKNSDSTTSLQDTLQKSMRSLPSLLRRDSTVSELKTRELPLINRFSNPSKTNFLLPMSESQKIVGSIFGPVDCLLSLPPRDDIHDNTESLVGEIESYVSLLDRPLGQLFLREGSGSGISFQVLTEDFQNTNSLGLCPGPGYRLVALGPWDVTNAIQSRRIQNWVRRESLQGNPSEVFDFSEPLFQFLVKIAQLSKGWKLTANSWDLLRSQVSAASLQTRLRFFWVKADTSKLIHSAETMGLLCFDLGEPAHSGVIENDNPRWEMNLDSFTGGAAVSEISWNCPDIKAPTYGFDRAAVHPDEFLLKVTSRTSSETEIARRLLQKLSSHLFRSVLIRSEETAPITASRFVDQDSTLATALGRKKGWMSVDPQGAGVAAADHALRGLLSVGASVRNAVVDIWAPLIRNDDQSAAQMRHEGQVLLAIQGAISYLKFFGASVRSIDISGEILNRESPEIIVRARNVLDRKSPLLVPGFRMVGELLYAIGPKPAFVDSGSKILDHVRVVSNYTFKLVPSNQAGIYDVVDDLIHRGLVTCIRPIGEGGIAETLGEMALWGGLGAQVRPNIPVIELFSSSPGRFVIGVLPQEGKNLESRVKSEYLSPLGATGSEKIMGLPISEFQKERRNL